MTSPILFLKANASVAIATNDQIFSDGIPGIISHYLVFGHSTIFYTYYQNYTFLRLRCRTDVANCRQVSIRLFHSVSANLVGIPGCAG